MLKPSRILAYIFVITLAIITLFPFLYMLSASVMSFQEATRIPPALLPSQPQWSNFSEAMSAAPFGRYFFNTVFVALATTSGTLITTILAAFALNFLNFRFKNGLQLLFIALLMIPFEVVVFTNYRTIAQLGLLDTYHALILPFLASVFYLFYLREYLTAVPMSYYKAAKVDGCSNLDFIVKVMIPLSKSALFTIALLNFIASWNSFLWPILVTNSTEMRMISNGLSAFATEVGASVQLQMAASAITVIPILILYFIFRNQIIKGVSRSGIKG